MDLQKLTVGQMAELNHVTEQTLRLYDRENLLKPRYTDPATGYRYYHIGQSARLDFIQSLKLYGMTLKEIAYFLENSTAESMGKLLEKQSEAIELKIRKLNHSKAAINRSLENYRRYQTMPKNGEIFYEYMPRRSIFSYSCGVNYFEQDESGYEFMLRQLKSHLVFKNVPLSYFSNIGTIIRREYLAKGELYSDEVFLFVDEQEDSGGLEKLEESTYICLCDYEFDKEAENAWRLLKYAKENNLEITGDYLCEVITDFPMLDASRRSMFYKTQIPVRFFG